MLQNVLNEIEVRGQQEYKTNLITLFKFTHFSLGFPEIKEYLKVIKIDSVLLRNKILNYIDLYDHKIVNSTYPSYNRVTTLFYDVTLSDIISVTNLHETHRQSVYQQQQTLQPDVHYISFLYTIATSRLLIKDVVEMRKIFQEVGLTQEFITKKYKEKPSDKKNSLDKFCTNLNELAQSGKINEVIGRSNEIEQLVHILNKTRKNNPILVGKAGTGKTAIIEGLALKIVKGEVPDKMKKAVIYNLEMMNIVKDTSFRGQFEKNMSEMMQMFKSKEEEGEMPILFIDEIHTIMGAGSGGKDGMDFSNIIKPALARGELRTIGSTTTDEWHQFIKQNPALDRRFHSISVKEPSIKEANEIVLGSLPFYEKNHNLKYFKNTSIKAVELSNQFIVDNALPDKAFDLIDFAGSMCNIAGKKQVTVEDIEIALSKTKNIPLEAIISSRKNKVIPINEVLSKHIFGQDEAINLVSKSVNKALVGLNNPNKPYGVFLFNGPTGTGKTELAKQIAIGMNANFHRIDCSELSQEHTVSKLIGAPAGYVGFDQGSSLTKIINENPRTVLLLDEFDKAHREIQKIFLQAFDYGQLTDGQGKIINCRNVLFIMTANFSTSVKKSIALSDAKVTTTSEWNNALLPEFRARLSGNQPIEFNPLNEHTYTLIIDKFISELNSSRFKSIKLKISLDESMKKEIIRHAISMNLGARTISEYIENNIVDKIVESLMQDGDKKINNFIVKFDNGKILFE